MLQNKELRALTRARRKRRARLQLIALVLGLLVFAAAVFLIVRANRGGPADPPAQSGETTAAPSGTDPAQTEQGTETGQPSGTQSPSDPEPTEPATSAAEATTEPGTQGETEAPTEPTGQEPTEPETPGDESWKLLLVNADHPLPEGFSVKLKELRNGHHVDERIYPELQQMFDDARAAGIHPFINESYRTSARQQEIMDKYVANYMAAGMSREQAEAEARKLVAIPGTSEHELGLALDIIAEFDADSTATWLWLRENAPRYGFILRYPEGKEEITGISYEPWHFRYVGVPTAQEITESGLCLEESIAPRN